MNAATRTRSEASIERVVHAVYQQADKWSGRVDITTTGTAAAEGTEITDSITANENIGYCDIVALGRCSRPSHLPSFIDL